MQRSTRMQRELSILTNEPPPGILCWMVDDQIDKLQAEILGSKETPYGGGSFRLEIQIPERYPFYPPKVRFVTKIYHPNIDGNGVSVSIHFRCLQKGAWKPAWNISTVLTSIQLLMAEPNPEDPLVAEISEEFKYNRPQFLQKAKEWTQKYATFHKVMAASGKVSSTGANKESDDSSDSDDESSDEENAENKPSVHPTQGVKESGISTPP
ncbi:Ubiquitin-conjugating enzyme E2 T [Desmophyllum pertusum]|uniref:Ubiquitin-conjugating enzyme E2 T n=1 Tax=Desmophyllum pertusum TaxID=174260 RepID=A0A9X0CR98_9CNID|nr:Ubiquitin-conjugating enzyme E2 T [Desmophyllum pertusum]